MAKRLLIPIISFLLITSCSSPEELTKMADKAKETVESELPGALDKAKDALGSAGQLADQAKAYVYDSVGYDKIKQFENDIRKQTIIQMPSQNGNITVDLSGLSEVIGTANSLKSLYTDEYNKTVESEQSKEIERTVTIDATGSDMISLAKNLASADVDNIVIRSGKVEVAFSPKMLAEEFANHENVNVAISDAGNSYKITFEDGKGEEIKLLDNVTVSIDGKRLKRDSVIYDLQSGAEELIGGMVEDDKLTFQIKSGGDFTVGTNTAKYNDIGGEDKQTKEAIESLAAKGIFNTTVDEFNPDDTVTRAEAVMMTTKTLYKYDDDFEVGFLDVSSDDWYYTAVASGAAEKIVNGYPDNTFRPSNIISKQELLTIAANTLVSDRKFLLPEDVSDYLNDVNEIAEWARPYVAMTVRDGIIEQDYAVNGGGEITRAEAALILYNLLERL